MSSKFRDHLRESLPTAAVMLLASVALGVVYNQSSPLGVRKARSVANAPLAVAAVPAKAPAAAPVSANVRTGYFNQTLSLSFVPAAGAAPTAAAPPTTAAPVAHQHGKFAEVTWPEVKTLIAQNKTLLVDARLAAHYDLEHIPGAISLPATSTPAEVAAFVARHGKETVFTVYCGSAKCGMSHNLASLLAAQGCTQVKIMTGGYAEYRAAQTGAAQ